MSTSWFSSICNMDIMAHIKPHCGRLPHTVGEALARGSNEKCSDDGLNQGVTSGYILVESNLIT